MTEKDLIELGFKKEYGDLFYYYTLDIGTDYEKLCLISNAHDETENGEWSVFIFNYESFQFTSRFQLEKLIQTLRYAIKTKNTKLKLNEN